MADERDIIETVLQYLSTDDRPQYTDLVTRLTQRVARTISAFHYWDWRNTYKDLTANSANPVHTLPNDCESIDQDGAALLDSSGDPSGKPLVYVGERRYHELRATTDAPSDACYYIPLKKKTAAGLIQVRFWPNITKTARVWYWRIVSSQDIAHIGNEIMLVSGILHLLPAKLVADTARHEKQFYAQLSLAKRRDKRARAKKVYVRQHPLTSKHNRFMRQIQS